MTPNRRILLVGDMPAIYEDLRKILASLVLEHPGFNDAEAALFGDAPPVRLLRSLASCIRLIRNRKRWPKCSPRWKRACLESFFEARAWGVESAPEKSRLIAK